MHVHPHRSVRINFTQGTVLLLNIKVWNAAYCSICIADIYRRVPRLLHFSFHIQPVVRTSKHKQIDWMLTARKGQTLRHSFTRHQMPSYLWT